MLVMALQLKVVLVVVRLRSPEIGASRCCRIMKVSNIRVILMSSDSGKYNLGKSSYGKNLTLLSVSNKDFAHRLART
jgi:hypothetical protein